MQRTSVRILIAEDEQLLQHLVRKQLAVLGHHSVDFAENGEQAVAMARETRYRIILMDVMMPDLDGVMATKLIRDHEKSTGLHVPIIAMTGIGDRSRCLGAGMDDYLQKPVMLAPLKEALNKWLNLQGGEATSWSHRMDKLTSQEDELAETDEKLDAIQHRIDELRKRFGLES